MRKFVAKHAALTTGMLSCFASSTERAGLTLIKRLHLRGLVAKIPRSRRRRITELGHTVMSAAIQLREEDFPTAFLKTAA